MYSLKARQLNKKSSIEEFCTPGSGQSQVSSINSRFVRAVLIDLSLKSEYFNIKFGEYLNSENRFLEYDLKN